ARTATRPATASPSSACGASARWASDHERAATSRSASSRRCAMIGVVARDLLVGKGSVLGERYRIVDVIGVGGSGTVYRAEDTDRGALVVLKLMHASHPESDTERRRFNREAAMVRGLRHPNVVELLDYGFTTEAIPYLVFPLLEG